METPHSLLVELQFCALVEELPHAESSVCAQIFFQRHMGVCVCVCVCLLFVVMWLCGYVVMCGLLFCLACLLNQEGVRQPEQV